MIRLLPLLALGFACNGDDPKTTDSSPDDEDTDTDADADADADTDADADADADTDTDTDTAPIEDADLDGSPDDVDCDDTDPTVFPGASDVCGDDRVTDCDRASDDGLVTVDGTTTFTDLRAALAAATDGVEVRVCAGTWVGPFESPVAVDLRAHGTAVDTVLDGDAAGSVLRVPGGSTVTGFTVRNGQSQDVGGGIAQTTAGTLTITDTVVSDNVGRLGGGVWIAAGGVAVVTGSTISGNRADLGGGLVVDDSGSIDLGTSVVSDNGALAGGGLFVVAGTVAGGDVHGNLSYGTDASVVGGVEIRHGGGGIAAIGPVTVTGTDLGFNTAPKGGGLLISGGTSTVTDVRMHDNLADVWWTLDDGGGGLAVLGADVTLAGTTEIVANTSTVSGGGFLLRDAQLTGGRVASNVADENGGGGDLARSTLVGATVESNVAADDGGGVKLEASHVVGSTLTGNEASTGGGVFVYPLEPSTVTDTAVSGNTAWRGGGLGLYGDSSMDRVDLLRVTVSDNVATDLGGGFYAFAEVRMTDSSVLRNVHPTEEAGGGAFVGYWATLESYGTDWGTGADDNVPDDVGMLGLSYLHPEGTGDMVCFDDACTLQ